MKKCKGVPPLQEEKVPLPSGVASFPGMQEHGGLRRESLRE